MTNLETVARALAKRRGCDCWEGLDESDRVGFRLDAVAALEAMHLFDEQRAAGGERVVSKLAVLKEGI